MPSGKALELAQECKRLSENCLYSSTSLLIWLRVLRVVKLVFIGVPLVLGSLASWSLLTTSELESVKVFVAICSFFAGLLPTVYSAFKFDEHLEQCRHVAGEFKNLQDRFRQAALVSSQKSFAEFEEDVAPLIDRLERTRGVSITAPEWCFKRAQRKVQSGDYTFDVDEAAVAAAESENTAEPTGQAGGNVEEELPEE